MKTKEEVIAFLKDKYNPDKTTIELSDLFDFFGITPKDLFKDLHKNEEAKK